MQRRLSKNIVPVLMVLAAIACGDAVQTDQKIVPKQPPAKQEPGEPSPLPLAAPTKTVASVNIGNYYCYILLADQKTYCKGEGTKGQLGDNLLADSMATPVEVAAPAEVGYFVDVQVGYEHVCALSDMGQIYCWGDASDGKLGRDTSANAAVPTQIDNPSGTTYFVDVMVGYSHACAIDQDHRTFCWGKGDGGQMGNGLTDVSNPTLQEVSAPNPADDTEYISDLQPGQGDFTCALSDQGNTYCWGSNANVGITLAAIPTVLTPLQITYPSATEKIARIRSGFAHTCGISVDDNFFCWGNNQYGQLGSLDNASATYYYQTNAYNSQVEYITKVFPGELKYCIYTDMQKLYCNKLVVPQPLVSGYVNKEVTVPGNVELEDFQPGVPNVGVTVDNLIVEVTI